MLKKIKDIIKPRRNSGFPYNITGSEYAALKELRSHPHWETYTEFLDKFSILLAEDMFQASDEKAVMYYRSFISGIRRAGTLIDEMIQDEKAKDARTKQRTDRDSRSDDSKRLAAYGSPYFSR